MFKGRQRTIFLIAFAVVALAVCVPLIFSVKNKPSAEAPSPGATSQPATATSGDGTTATYQAEEKQAAAGATPATVTATNGQGTTLSYQVQESAPSPEPTKPCPTAEAFPAVASYLVSPTKIKAGESATLSWEAQVTKRATITDLTSGAVTVVSPQSGKLIVTPASSRTYRLTVESSCGTLTQDITLTVVNK